MKKLMFFLVAFFSIQVVMAQGAFKFASENHDFGDFREGIMAEQVFTFTNTGNAPIVISSVKASCGCTTPEWPKEPVMPGETASIKAVYNSKGRPGSFYKTITIVSNAAEPNKVLSIKGNVLPEAQQPK